jgi:hypothetical protein
MTREELADLRRFTESVESCDGSTIQDLVERLLADVERLREVIRRMLHDLDNAEGYRATVSMASRQFARAALAGEDGKS